MGTFSTVLFSDDTACEVRDRFIELLSNGFSPPQATEALLHSWAAALGDADDGPVFWLALAATQWKYGCLGQNVLAHAIGIIDSGVDLQKWEGVSIGRRRTVLSTLKTKLLSPQPAPRRPPRRKPVVVVPSTKVPSPDGRALATAFALGWSPQPNAPRMQVFIEMESSGSRGGGGVFVANCEYTEATLEWLDSETLQIAYPKSAVVSDQKPTLFYYGRTILLAYLAIA